MGCISSNILTVGVIHSTEPDCAQSREHTASGNTPGHTAPSELQERGHPPANVFTRST